MRAFQQHRGLRVDGVCGKQTWGALVEAGYRLGDRLLYRQAKMLRGDDVAALQRRLGALGFDAGRVDGIFGENTARALLEFQRNVGLTVDGICGPSTLQALDRLGERTEAVDHVAAVRERDALRHGPHHLDGQVIGVGDAGGLDALARAVARALSAAGANAVVLDHPDGSAQAAEANRLGASLYLGLTLSTDTCSVAYYQVTGYVSYGGRALSAHLRQRLPSVLGEPCGTRGMSLPVLRETRAPALVCELAPPALVVQRTAGVARALTEAVVRWVEDPAEE